MNTVFVQDINVNSYLNAYTSCKKCIYRTIAVAENEYTCCFVENEYVENVYTCCFVENEYAEYVYTCCFVENEYNSV